MNLKPVNDQRPSMRMAMVSMKFPGWTDHTVAERNRIFQCLHNRVAPCIIHYFDMAEFLGHTIRDLRRLQD